uniref:Uncharacterized protein n=1 Tax=Rhizophora mucronata TaxID=61149 RepID=A0A2P2P9L1_RHIMU
MIQSTPINRNSCDVPTITT